MASGPKALNVLMVTWEYPPFYTGGVGTACRGITRFLLQNGLFVVVWLPWTDRTFEPDTAGDFDYPEGEAEFPGYGRHGVYDSDIILPLTAGFEPGREFDIIHCHDWSTIPAALDVRDRYKKPLIVHIHSLESDRSPGRGNPEIAALEKKGCLQADMVIAVSRYTADKIESEYGIDRKKIRVLYNGYELEEKGGGVKEYNPGGKSVLLLGRLVEQKGSDIFLEAALGLSNVRSDTVFIIAGSGPMERDLLEMARAAREKEKIIFTGFIPHHELSPLLWGTDILVLPSLSEPFGIVGLEAMSCGCTVVVTQTAGLNEVVRNVVALERPDPTDLVSLLANLLDAPEECERIGRAAAEETAGLGWDLRGKELLSLYDELLAMPRS